jgi:hypothetical protein
MSWTALDYITSRIQKRLEGFYITDDTLPQLEVIADEAHKARGDIIKAAKFINPPPQYFQKVCCLKVQCEQQMCDGRPTGVKRTFVDLGSGVMGAWGKKAIRFLGVEGVFSMEWRDSAKDFKSPYMKSNTAYFTLSGSVAELFNLPTPNVEFVCVEFLSSDPMAALTKSECDDAYEQDYPFPADELGMLEDLVVKRLGPSKGIRPDYQNNANSKPQQ